MDRGFFQPPPYRTLACYQLFAMLSFSFSIHMYENCTLEISEPIKELTVNRIFLKHFSAG